MRNILHLPRFELSTCNYGLILSVRYNCKSNNICDFSRCSVRVIESQKEYSQFSKRLQIISLFISFQINVIFLLLHWFVLKRVSRDHNEQNNDGNLVPRYFLSKPNTCWISFNFPSVLIDPRNDEWFSANGFIVVWKLFFRRP